MPGHMVDRELVLSGDDRSGNRVLAMSHVLYLLEVVENLFGALFVAHQLLRSLQAEDRVLDDGVAGWEYYHL